CSVSGNIPGDYCEDLIKTWFIPGVSPITRCRVHRPVYIDTRTGFRTDETDKPYIRAEIREFWPTDLLEIFNQAGLPRFVPPPYAPEDDSVFRGSVGFPPSIISPLSYTTYVVRKDEERFRELVLMASADQDGGELFWFANSSFLGKALPNEKLLWRPEPGIYNLSVVDSRGRSTSTVITISLSEE
ncbi:MAG: penicillin-binding protein 1C, partial [Treponema sp.]|nr:penicillin-binding protein 1C [Treponema sp.]